MTPRRRRLLGARAARGGAPLRGPTAPQRLAALAVRGGLLSRGPAAPQRLAALAAVLALAACRERADAPGSGSGSGSGATAAAPPAGGARAQTRPLYPAALTDLVEGARRGVVAIRATSPVRSGPAAMYPGASEPAADVALGTGFLVETHGAHVLTTLHIAAASPSLRVVLPGGAEAPAKLIGRDEQLDLALLSLDVPAGLAPSGLAPPGVAPLPLGDSDQLAVGEWIVVLGDPFGDEVTASAGIVSATGREAEGAAVPSRPTGFRRLLQLDARVHRGNSGGPVLDTAGQVVGLAVATGDRPGELSFAIPINRVRDELDRLRETGTIARSWLGVLVKPVTADLAQQLALPRPAGALVTEIKAGSPAARSTLRVGDVILRWADREVDHRSLPFLVAQTPVGKSISIAVWRNGAEAAVSLVTEKMPE